MLSVEVSEFKQQQQSDLEVEAVGNKATYFIRLIEVNDVNDSIIELKANITDKDTDIIQINSLKLIKSNQNMLLFVLQ